MNFTVLQAAVGKQFKAMSSRTLYTTGVDKDALWALYLESFPAGSNPMYRKRTEHDCSCCRQFIGAIGGVVTIVGGTVITLWDCNVGDVYQPVVDVLADFVREQPIENVFLHPQQLVGTALSRELLEDKSVKAWDHLYVNLPKAVVKPGVAIGQALGEFRSTHDVFARGLAEITEDAIQTVRELISQGSLYRGEEHAAVVGEFSKLKAECPAHREAADLFAWEQLALVSQSVSRIRNTVIGTLLVDLSEGKELEDAVRAFESKVAPTNYKRPTALVTKAMVAAAQKKVDELGLTTALERRYATMEDITVANTLFADRSARRVMAAGTAAGAFADLAASVAVDVKKLEKVEEIGVEDFLTKILPSAQTLEVLFENRHAGNLVSLIAPVDPTANKLLKWSNGFSWAYAGDLADSIKEKVKAAGGSVTGDFRASLAWSNYDDLDLHLIQPNGEKIFFSHKIDHITLGNLDVDMNAHQGTTRTPVENITFPSRLKMREGEYLLAVHNFAKRETTNVGFEVEMEFDGMVYTFAYPGAIKDQTLIPVCKFTYGYKTGLKILESLPSKQSSKTIWGLPTQTFHKVRMVMLSPNHWEDQRGNGIGNKHLFFMLDGCRNDGVARGFFNEFLADSLTPHRKVLEMVGARMKTDKSESQLSGVGFSSTQRNHLMCRVTGAFARTVKVLL